MNPSVDTIRSAEIEGALLSDDAYDFVDGLRDACRENTNQSTM